MKVDADTINNWKKNKIYEKLIFPIFLKNRKVIYSILYYPTCNNYLISLNVLNNSVDMHMSIRIII